MAASHGLLRFFGGKRVMICPSCGSQRICKDGLRQTTDEPIQRYLCGVCGYRFSEPQKKFKVISEGRSFNSSANLTQSTISDINLPIKESIDYASLPFSKNICSHGATIVGKKLNNLCSYNSNNQICVTKTKGSKNLVKVENRNNAGLAGATKLTDAETRGKIVEFIWWMKKQGYKDSTIISRRARINRLVNLGANLLDPENIKEIIATQDNWKESRKEAMVYAYDLFVKWIGIDWERPFYKPPRTLPFIPSEREIDDLIAGTNKHIAAFLQLGKETGARAGEIFALDWTDITFENKTVNITAEKGSNSRILRISNKLIGMLHNINKTNEKVFSHYQSLATLRRTFERHRKRVAHNLGNAKLLKITFHTLRHWKATTEYNKTKDILHVMKILGHRNIKNTLLYTQLLPNDQDEEYISKIARTIDDARKLVEVGFEYVCQIEDAKLFRKRK